MKSREELFLVMAMDYKKKYKETPWWMFRKRNELKKNWHSAIECMIKFGTK